YYAGWAGESSPEEFPLAASAARSAAGRALDFAARDNISVHGGIGATWEHDAPYFFRRAQLSRRLLGGTGDATDRVAAELFAAAYRPDVEDRARPPLDHLGNHLEGQLVHRDDVEPDSVALAAGVELPQPPERPGPGVVAQPGDEAPGLAQRAEQLGATVLGRE